MPLRQNQKLFPHLGEAGTAVFAVKEVEYGGHDLTSLLDLHHDLNAIIFLGARDVNSITTCPSLSFRFPEALAAVVICGKA